MGNFFNLSISKVFTKFSCLFLTLCLVISCTTTAPQNLPVNDLKNSESLSKIDNKTEKEPLFSIKGEKSEDKAKVIKKNKDVLIELDTSSEKEDLSKIPPPKHFSIKALSQTTFYPQEIGTEVSFDVYADYGQPWIIVIQGPKTTVCNAVVTQRVRSTGPVSFTLFLPATFPLTGDYNVFIGDRDPYTNAMLNSTYLGNLKISNPKGLTLTKSFESDTQLFLNFSNKTGDIFKYELFGPSSGSYSCLYFSSGSIFINKSVLAAGKYTAKISLMQYPDISATYNFTVIQTIPQLITALPSPIPQRLSPSFDNVPPADTPKVPGAVTVIYKNDAKIRRTGGFSTKSVPDGNNGHGNDANNCDPSNPGKSNPDCPREPGISKTVTLNSANPEDAIALNAILKKYKIQSASDGAAPDETEAQMDEDLQIVSQKVDGEVPHKLSLHFYNFPENADTNAIAAELRQLSFVRTAYPSVMIEQQGNFELKGQTTVADDVKYNGTFINGIRQPATPMPNDIGFGRSEKDEWWWFNRFHVFQGWDFYTWALGKTSGITNLDDLRLPKPKIAVIDSGFDTTIGNDTPNFEGGMLVELDKSGVIVPTFVNSSLSNINIVQQTAADFDITGNPIPLSHGALVASVIASPRNNSKNLAGIIPGAKIYPVKVKFANQKLPITENLIFNALNFTAYYGQNLDAINISLGIRGLPVNFVPSIGMAITYTTLTKKIPIVIAAGNYKNNLEANKPTTPDCTRFGYPECLNYGQITVGGTTSSALIWDDGTVGSNYGLGVNVVAGAKDISGSSFELKSGIRDYYIHQAGTSLAAPMVAATLGMMKKISGGRFDALDLIFLLTDTGTVSRAEIKKPEDKFLGTFLNMEQINKGNIVRMRELNVYNALIMTYYLSSVSPYVVRLFNTDGKTRATINEEWTTRQYTDEGEGNDSFWVHDDTLADTDKLSFITNAAGKTPTFGYQLYNFKNHTITERLLGVRARHQSYTSGFPQLYSNFTKDGVVTDSSGYILETDPTFPGKACCNIVLKY